MYVCGVCEHAGMHVYNIVVTEYIGLIDAETKWQIRDLGWRMDGIYGWDAV